MLNFNLTKRAAVSLGCLYMFKFLTGHVGSPTELGEDEPFLCTDQGSPFTPVFRHIRLQYIINDLASARILERDNIVPPGKIAALTPITAAPP